MATVNNMKHDDVMARHAEMMTDAVQLGGGGGGKGGRG